MKTKACNPDMSVRCSNEGELQIRLSGDWRIGIELQTTEKLRAEMESTVRSITPETRMLSGWDSSLLIFLIGVKKLCAEKGVKLDLEGLPHGCRLCSPDRDDAGEQRNRCPLDPRNFTDGVSIPSANGGLHRKDAAALP